MESNGYTEFERYVNSKDNQTISGVKSSRYLFERYVNSKDNQTYTYPYSLTFGLRDM